LAEETAQLCIPHNIAREGLDHGSEKQFSERIAQLDAQKKALQARALGTTGTRQRHSPKKCCSARWFLHRLETPATPSSSETPRDCCRRELPGFLSAGIRQDVVAAIC